MKKAIKSAVKYEKIKILIINKISKNPYFHRKPEITGEREAGFKICTEVFLKK